MKDTAFESFVNPDHLYYGTDFWMLNGKLDNVEIVRQLTDMRDHGIYNFIARTYVGLDSDYPGPDFKSKMRCIIDTARSLDMKLFLQAGYMPDDVVGLPIEYTLRSLKIYKSPDMPLCGERELYSDGEYTITEGMTDHALDIFDADSIDYYLRVSYEEMWQEFSSEFGKTILSIWVDEPSFPGNHLPYPHGIEDAFLEKYGYSLKENVNKLFFDIPGYKTVRYHYRQLLLDMMENNYFKKLNAWCSSHGVLASGHLLFEETLETQISRAVAVMPFYRYFDIPGVDILSSQQNWRRRALKPISGDYRYREVMMTTPIQCASAARQSGKEHVLCEMYGVTSEDMGFREQKHMFDYTAAHGINHKSVHGIFYSLKGRAKRLYPPHINYYQPYWQDMKSMNDYIASVSRFVTLGMPEGDTLVIHPLDSAYCEYTCRADSRITGRQPSCNDIEKRDKRLIKLVTTLSLSGCNFDFGDERSIEAMGRVDGGAFIIGEMSYKTVVLPDLAVLKSSTLDLVKQFSRIGGRVIVVGSYPTMLDGVETHGNLLSECDNVMYVSDSSELVPLIKPRDYSLCEKNSGMDIIVRRRMGENRAYYYLFNTDCSESKDTVLSLDGNFSAERWCAMTRTRTPVRCVYKDGKTEISLTIPEGGNAMLVAYPIDAHAPSADVRSYRCIELPDSFKVDRETPNALLLEFCAFKKKGGEYGCEYPILAVKDILTREDYEGEISLRFEFVSDVDINGAHLVLEDRDECEITFNGELVSNTNDGFFLDRSFETVLLPKIRAGRNVVEIKRIFVPIERSLRGVDSLFETRIGTELEAMYVIGDFAVRAIEEPERSGAVRYSRRGMKLAEEKRCLSGELTRGGYPFFAGTISLTYEFEYCGSTDNVVLSLDALDACVCHAELNGKDIGFVLSTPYTFDASPALQEGKNVLKLTLSNTIRNLIGPYHRPDGDRGHVRGTYGYSDLGWMGCTGVDDDNWYHDRSVDTALWTDSYLQVPFGAFGVKLIQEI